MKRCEKTRVQKDGSIESGEMPQPFQNIRPFGDSNSTHERLSV
jgi:hypothetical protein